MNPLSKRRLGVGFALFIGFFLTSINIQASEELGRANGCHQCHGAEREIVSPTYAEIAERYRGQPQAIETLINSITNGSKGKWTDMSDGGPMPPYGSRLLEDKIEQLARWIMDQ